MRELLDGWSKLVLGGVLAPAVFAAVLMLVTSPLWLIAAVWQWARGFPMFR